MAFQNKINWSAPHTGIQLLSSTSDAFKTAVLDYHIQIEGELENIIRMAFRDPDEYKTHRFGFARRVSLVRALIGKSPNDEIWKIVKKLPDLRNEYAHGMPRPQTVQKYIDELQQQLETIGFNYAITSGVYNDSRLDILASAHFAVGRFFWDIKEWLKSQRV